MNEAKFKNILTPCAGTEHWTITRHRAEKPSVPEDDGPACWSVLL